MKNQAGMGLVEVLVALLLLAVAILGFSAMQINAVKATDESIVRSRALTVMRAGAETMRGNPDGIDAFRIEMNKLASSPKKENVGNECFSNACTPKKLAVRDAKVLHNYAIDNDVKMNVVICPGTSDRQARQCMIASWGETEAQMSADAKACIKADGTYNSGASCFVMEAY